MLDKKGPSFYFVYNPGIKAYVGFCQQVGGLPLGWLARNLP